MSVELNPMRWPGNWKDASALAFLNETPINCLVAEKGALPESVAARAKEKGLTVVDPAAPPAGIFIAEGVWPGVQAQETSTTAGPTGNPWVDSNGWKVRLEQARHPAARVWVDARPKGQVFPDAYQTALADSAVYGGRWIVSLDDQIAAAMAQGKAGAVAAWKKIAAAARFFEDRKAWSAYTSEAVVGIMSDFTGDNEFMGGELLNLVARTNQQYRVILKNKLSPASFANLKAVIYGDATAPTPAVKNNIMAFVQGGGLLITNPKWGIAPGMRASNQDNERYVWRTSGKGRIAFAKTEFDDPWVIAQESVLLISHRHDLLRFWNGGAVGSYFTMAPDRKRALVHMLFYADRGPDEVGVRVAGNYRSGKLWTLDGKQSAIEIIPQRDAVELHLPAAAQYAAAELEA
ncbi:MAG: hypothetical protein NTW28_06780 [Candidatus Solibacter sp.]|nr:hypothetical protein [Candidatus Solibacter sp.]